MTYSHFFFTNEEKQHTFKNDELFYIPCLSNLKKFPAIIVTKEAKEFFARAKCKGDLDAKGNPMKRGQGLIGILWLGKDVNNHPVLYASLLPAFNKNDGLLREDKTGKQYELHEIAYTDEPLGGNTGRNHEQLKEAIIKNIHSAIDKKDDLALKMYEGLYTLSGNKIILDDLKLFGFGVFKGNKQILIDQLRIVSANLNMKSVRYNPSFIYENYFTEDKSDAFQREFFIRRQLPPPLEAALAEALIRQLPQEEKDTPKQILIIKSITDLKEMSNHWKKKPPLLRINALMNTLSDFCHLTSSKTEEVKITVALIKNNLQIEFPFNKKKQQNHLDMGLTQHNASLQYAINNNHHAILQLLINEISDDASNYLKFFLESAIHKNNVEAVSIILQKYKDTSALENGLYSAMSKGHFEIANLLIQHGVRKHSDFNQTLLSGLIKLGEKHDYHGIKKIFTQYSEFNFSENKPLGEALLDSLTRAIQAKSISHIDSFKHELPEYFEKLAKTPMILQLADASEVKEIQKLIKTPVMSFEEEKKELMKERLIEKFVLLCKNKNFKEMKEYMEKNPFLTLSTKNYDGISVELFLSKAFEEVILANNIEKLTTDVYQEIMSDPGFNKALNLALPPKASSLSFENIQNIFNEYKGIDLNIKDDKGDTIISQFIKNNQLDKIKQFYSVYPNIFESSFRENTLLAVEHGNIETIYWFMQYHQRNKQEIDQTFTLLADKNPNLRSSIMHYILLGKIDKVKELKNIFPNLLKKIIKEEGSHLIQKVAASPIKLDSLNWLYDELEIKEMSIELKSSLNEGLLEIASQHDYAAAAKLMQKFKNLSLSFSLYDSYETVENTFFVSMISDIRTGNVEKLLEFKTHFPMLLTPFLSRTEEINYALYKCPDKKILQIIIFLAMNNYNLKHFLKRTKMSSSLRETIEHCILISSTVKEDKRILSSYDKTMLQVREEAIIALYNKNNVPQVISNFKQLETFIHKLINIKLEELKALGTIAYKLFAAGENTDSIIKQTLVKARQLLTLHDAPKSAVTTKKWRFSTPKDTLQTKLKKLEELIGEYSPSPNDSLTK